MTETESFPVSKHEYHALNEIRGLSSDAFSLVVGATLNDKGHYILEGSAEAFDSLTKDVSDEIYYELSPKSRRNCRKLWI